MQRRAFKHALAFCLVICLTIIFLPNTSFAAKSLSKSEKKILTNAFEVVMSGSYDSAYFKTLKVYAASKKQKKDFYSDVIFHYLGWACTADIAKKNFGNNAVQPTVVNGDSLQLSRSQMEKIYLSFFGSKYKAGINDVLKNFSKVYNAKYKNGKYTVWPGEGSVMYHYAVIQRYAIAKSGSINITFKSYAEDPYGTKKLIGRFSVVFTPYKNSMFGYYIKSIKEIQTK